MHIDCNASFCLVTCGLLSNLIALYSVNCHAMGKFAATREIMKGP